MKNEALDLKEELIDLEANLRIACVQMRTKPFDAERHAMNALNIITKINELNSREGNPDADTGSGLHLAGVKPSFSASKQYLVDQNTFEFNHELLKERGWESETLKNHIFSWQEYYKYWHIQDGDGSGYEIKISLRQHENIALLYVNESWVGRALTFADAENVVNSIRTSCK